MHRVIRNAVRGVAVVAVVCALTVTAEARPSVGDGGSWFGKAKSRLQQILRRVVTFGDEISVPKI
jgi:hypothetical protein